MNTQLWCKYSLLNRRHGFSPWRKVFFTPTKQVSGQARPASIRGEPAEESTSRKRRALHHEPDPNLARRSFPSQFGHRRDIGRGNAIGIVRTETDRWSPAEAETRSTDAAHRVAAFGEEAAMLDEFIELVTIEKATELSMRAFFPAAFQIAVLVGLVALGLVPKVFDLRRGESGNVLVLGHVHGIDDAENSMAALHLAV